MPAQTISAFARRFGLSRTTLLYYHRIGLLPPAAVNTEGHRLYGEKEAERMKRIGNLREAGLGLEAIREILDEGGDSRLEAALEQRLAAINREMEVLRRQQRLAAQLLRRNAQGSGNVGVAQWVAMLEEAGVDEAGRRRWHQAFERDAPEAHREFLVSLGLDGDEVEKIRREARRQDV